LDDCSASFLTSSATTANPFPASPAFAASIAAFRERRFVWAEIFDMVSDTLPISSTPFENLAKFHLSFWKTLYFSWFFAKVIDIFIPIFFNSSVFVISFSRMFVDAITFSIMSAAH